VASRVAIASGDTGVAGTAEGPLWAQLATNTKNRKTRRMGNLLGPVRDTPIHRVGLAGGYVLTRVQGVFIELIDPAPEVARI
jgi:hypothetical protein